MQKRRKYAIYALIGLAITAFSLWHYLILHTLAQKLQVSDLDTEKGEAIYIRAPDGAQMITGSVPMGVLLKPVQNIEFPNNHRIDILVITGTTAAAYGGFIDIIRIYDIGIVIEPSFVSKAKTYAELQSAIKEKRIPIISLKGTTKVILDELHGISYSVFCPTPIKVSSNFSCLVNPLKGIIGRLL